MNSVNLQVQFRRCPGRLGPEYVERSLAMVCVGTFLLERFSSDTGVFPFPAFVERFKLVVFF